MEPYTLIRSARKTLSISVDADGRLVARAPKNMPKATVEGFLRAKAGWIEKKRAQARACASALAPIELREGAPVPYLGESYALAFREVDGIALEGERLVVPRDTDADALALWLRAEALTVLNHRVALYAGLMGLSYASVKVTGAKARWGSCSGKRSLNFAWRLIFCPLSVVDYVVVHELSHIEHMDHSPAFWARVASVLPDCKARRLWLKQNRRVMELI